MNIQPGEIGHIIQLAIAPVFLLTGVGTNMLVLTNRLARIIDRTRELDERLEDALPSVSARARLAAFDALDILFRRARKINRAISASFIYLLREVLLATEFQETLRQKMIRDYPP